MKRYLIVIEDKISEKRYLHNPFAKGQKVVPAGFYKVTQQVPLNEEKFGHLPLYQPKS